jgi:hypothetical protein
MPNSGPHDEFLELCALSVSGELNREEQARLEKHLAQCPSCRLAQQEYAAIIEHGLPKMHAELGPSPAFEDDSSWSVDRAEAEFFRPVQLEDAIAEEPVNSDGTEGDTYSEGDEAAPREDEALFDEEAISLAALESTWQKVWTLYAAAIVLFVALGFSAYQIGAHRNHSQALATAAVTSASAPLVDTGRLRLEQQLSDAGHQLELERAQLAQRDRSIADLRHRLEVQSSHLAQLSESVADANKSSTSIPGAQVAQESAVSKQQVGSAQAAAQSLRTQLELLEAKSTEETNRAAQLETKVSDLTRTLQEREAEADQQRQLLAHDRDIRDLMGARDLYIAEVYDVGRSGETRKPYGRLFYTKEKSLVFYAYDLDQQAGLRNASTFQAWGRRGPDRERALNLGIFYQDNAAKKRWVLKFNDAKTLDQIDAIFVTVEPYGGSSKPSSKPLLFAYLRVDPNHP